MHPTLLLWSWNAAESESKCATRGGCNWCALPLLALVWCVGGGGHVGDIHAYKEGLRRSMYGTVRD